MNNIKAFLKKIVYAVGANLFTLMASALTTLLVPKFLGNAIEQYGYLQIYLFYASYIGFFHLGWCDGIFLRDGGKRYSDLDRPMYSSQFWLIFLYSIMMSLLIVGVGFGVAKNDMYLFIFEMIGMNVIVYIPRNQLQYYLQATNRVKEYASITIIGRATYGITVLLVFLSGIKDYRLFIICDVVGKALALLVSVYWCRDIIKTKPVSMKAGIQEAILNISIGIKLLFANIASMLITGIVRWGIQQQWDVSTYAKIALTLDVSSLILVFISAVALVLYPTLRRIEPERLSSMYGTIRNILMIFLLGCLVFYCPLEKVLSGWLPQYAESMRYMAILFPLCVFAAKMTLLVQTYMNVLRQEKLILKINAMGVGVAVITTTISVFVLKSLTAAMVSIVLNQMFRCIYAEIELSKVIDIHPMGDILVEIILTVIFITVSWFIGSWVGVVLYLMAYIAYIIFKIKDIKEMTRVFKELM